MSLRKSPTHTPALLAANRANAQKSTGPHTAEGKSRAALNSFRYAFRAPKFLAALAKSKRLHEEFVGLYLALYAALLPDMTQEGTRDLLKRTALHVWAMKQAVMRWAASRAEREAFLAQTGGLLPPPLELLITRQGWKVRVSVWVRRGRGRGQRRLWETGADGDEGPSKFHVVVTVTSSMRHPMLGYTCLAEVPPGAAPRVVLKTKPECIRKQKGNENVITIKDLDAFLRECRQAADKRRCPPHRAGQSLAELLALAPDKGAVSPFAETAGDLLSWLRPENVALSGPHLSEFDDIESWINAVVTKWEKQHGSIPKKKLPHDIG